LVNSTEERQYFRIKLKIPLEKTSLIWGIKTKTEHKHYVYFYKMTFMLKCDFMLNMKWKWIMKSKDFCDYNTFAVFFTISLPCFTILKNFLQLFSQIRLSKEKKSWKNSLLNYNNDSHEPSGENWNLARSTSKRSTK
jgi:hypothetical protein